MPAQGTEYLKRYEYTYGGGVPGGYISKPLYANGYLEYFPSTWYQIAGYGEDWAGNEYKGWYSHNSVGTYYTLYYKFTYTTYYYTTYYWSNYPNYSSTYLNSTYYYTTYLHSN